MKAGYMVPMLGELLNAGVRPLEQGGESRAAWGVVSEG
jgi:hypothetical protein